MNDLLNRDELVRLVLQSAISSCLGSLGKLQTSPTTIAGILQQIVPAACKQALGESIHEITVGGNINDLPTFTARFPDGNTQYAFVHGGSGDIVIQRAFRPGGGLRLVKTS